MHFKKEKKWEIKIVSTIQKCTRMNILQNSARAQLNSYISFDSEMGAFEGEVQSMHWMKKKAAF